MNGVLIGLPEVLDDQDVLREVREAVAFIIKRSDKVRTGGYFTLLWRPFESADWTTMIHALVGKVPSGKVERYAGFSKEKAWRLAENIGFLHISSWQSRDPEQNRWGGAIFFPLEGNGQFILSFSGLPELADEAAMLLAAVHLGILSQDDVTARAKLNDNRIVLDLGARAFFRKRPGSR